MIKVPKAVHEGLEAVRKSARFNMFQVKEVGGWCLAYGYVETYEWMKANEQSYTLGIFEGFEVEPETIDPADAGFTLFEQDARQLVRLAQKYLLRDNIQSLVFGGSPDTPEYQADLRRFDEIVARILAAQSINVHLHEIERLKTERSEYRADLSNFLDSVENFIDITEAVAEERERDVWGTQRDQRYDDMRANAESVRDMLRETAESK